MKKIYLLFVFIAFITLTGCSQKEKAYIDVDVNGEAIPIPSEIFAIVSKTDERTVKAIIHPDDASDIKLVKNDITYKVFDRGNSAIVYFKDGEITQYEITSEELNKIKEALD